MRFPDKSVRWRLLFHLLIGAFVGLYVFSRFMPCAPVKAYPRADCLSQLDNGWSQALHLAFAGRMQFGTDLIFTYGPWGFLERGYHPQTFLWSMVSWAILSLVFLCAGWRLAGGFSKSQLAAGLWMVGFVAAASIPVGGDFNSRLAAWCLLLLFLHFFVEKGATTLLQAMLTVSLGWLSLVKFSGLIESGLLVAIIAIDNLFRQRRFPWIIPLWLAGFLLFWAAAGQRMNALVPFLYNSWQISSGYTEAMMLSGKWEASHLFYFLMIALLLSMMTAQLGWKRHRWFGLLIPAGVGVVLFLTFKLGFVRNDWQHEAASVMVLALVSMACLAVSRQYSSRMVWIASGLVVLSGVQVSTVFTQCFPGNELRPQFARTFSFDCLAAPILAPYTGYLQNYRELTSFHNRMNFPIPPLYGGVDIYSHGQTILFAHDLPYRPRPIPQSYSVYTPPLAKINADHLLTSAAADNILFAVQPIDDRFPSSDDGCSWPALLTHYDFNGYSDEKRSFLILSRTRHPGQFKLSLLKEALAGYGETVTVPDASNAPVWVEVEIKKTLTGILASTFYKPPMLMLTANFFNGSCYPSRLVPGSAAAGFLLSPLIACNQSFAELTTTNWPQALADLKVKTIKITAATSSGDTFCYRSPMEIRFYGLNYQVRDSKPAVTP